MSEGYKYSSILQLQDFLEQKANEDASEASIRVPFISEAYKYFSILQLQDTNIFQFCNFKFFWSKKQMRMQAKRASEFCLFLKHTNIFQSSILQLSKHQSEASIWVMLNSEAYKYFFNFATSIFLWSNKQMRMRAKRSSVFSGYIQLFLAPTKMFHYVPCFVFVWQSNQ